MGLTHAERDNPNEVWKEVDPFSRLTVRKAERPSGKRRDEEAKAAKPKGNRKAELGR